MKKRILALLSGGIIAAGATAGLSACGGDKGITIWAPSTQQTLIKELMADFLEDNPDFNIPIKYGVCGEDNAYAQISTDPEASADVYGFANDQLYNLRKAGALARLSDETVTGIKATDDLDALEAGRIGDAYYGYPYANDNGFFMYYDDSVVTAEDATTLEGVLAACARNKKYFIMRMNNQGSWYIGSFFFGAGGEYTMKWENTTLDSASSDFGKKAKDASGAETEYSVGQVAAQAMIDLRKNEYYLDGDDAVIEQYLSGNKLGAVITGTWNAAKIKDKFGTHYAATKCPTYHSSLTDTDYQIVPYIGYKLMGVNPSSKHLAEARQIAAYLTSEKAQQKRFDVLGIGPSNKVVAAKQEVKDNIALKALRSQTSFALVQPTLPSSYWSAFDAFGTDIYGGEGATTAARRDELVSTLISALVED